MKKEDLSGESLMDEKLAKHFRSRAIRAATKYGFKREAQDIAQEVLTRYAAGKCKGQTVDQTVIDIIRGQFGNPKRDNYLDKKKVKERFKLHLKSTQKENRITQENGNQFHKLINLLEGIERAVCVLTYLWGFDGEEIAYCFDIGPSRVSQIKHSAEAYLKQYLEREGERKMSRKCKLKRGGMNTDLDKFTEALKSNPLKNSNNI